MNKEIEILIDGKPTKMKLPPDMQDSKIVVENGKVFAEIGVVDYINNLKEENQRLKDRIDFYEDIESDRLAYIDELEKENQRLNNDIKILLKENEAKEKVIIKYENVLNELEKLTISICENCYEDRETERIKKRIKELKESDK